MQSLISKIKANTPGADNVIISTHCQNDLGLSTANSLAGAMGGARQVRFGHAALCFVPCRAVMCCWCQLHMKCPLCCDVPGMPVADAVPTPTICKASSPAPPPLHQIECTINGIGERAGNASLEEVVMAIALRG